MAEQLNRMKVAMLVTTAFEQVEFTEPRDALEEAGATVQLVSPEEDMVDAWDQGDWGDTFEVDVPLDQATPDEYDALVLPGGTYSPDKLRVNDDAIAFIKHFFDNGKPVAAICHGPWSLINAGVVEGRRMTSYKSVRLDLENAGAQWVDEEAVVDDSLVTSRNPDDLPAFNEAMIELFARTGRRAEPVS